MRIAACESLLNHICCAGGHRNCQKGHQRAALAQVSGNFFAQSEKFRLLSLVVFPHLFPRPPNSCYHSALYDTLSYIIPLCDLLEAMRTPHELVELSVFLILLGLALPMLKSLHDVYPVVAIVASIILFLPTPAWLARLRVAIPDRLETAIVWHSVAAWVIVLGVFCVGVVLALYKWCVAT